MNKSYILGAIIIILSACDSGVDFDDFRNTLVSISSNSAKDCGHIEIRKALLRQQSCAKDAFETHKDFYVSYSLQGVDSFVSHGFSFQKEGAFVVYFDSDPTGGARIGNGVVSIYKCIKPKYVGINWAKNNDMFECEELVKPNT